MTMHWQWPCINNDNDHALIMTMTINQLLQLQFQAKSPKPSPKSLPAICYVKVGTARKSSLICYNFNLIWCAASYMYIEWALLPPVCMKNMYRNMDLSVLRESLRLQPHALRLCSTPCLQCTWAILATCHSFQDSIICIWTVYTKYQHGHCFRI